ncbi:NF-kappa-B inhibitor cactus-like [Cydia pomonella]|uniref:NF-kappa-B inhibitor cactus-like n=1 Tax=Cydia pomonella TaxID=82600 RepID=UPI002ADE2206|nr:NF-kappa-B inhibitor cactus-like [Cydia pomonella]
MESNKLCEMLSVRNHLGETYFHEVCRTALPSLLDRVARCLDDEIPTILAIKNYNGEQCTHTIVKYEEKYAKEMMETVVDLGADINGQEGCGGFTPLHLCVWQKNYKLARWICGQRKTNLEAKTYAKKTAYQLAYEKKDDEMMKILKKAGAKCDPPKDDDE